MPRLFCFFRGICTNSKIIAASTVKRRVLAGVKTHPVSPEAIIMATTLYQEAAEEHLRMLERERAPMEKELVEIGRQLERPNSCSWRAWSTWTRSKP